jgi:hypothetical protein
MCDRLGLGVLALGPAAMFAVLMILAITTIVGALRSDIHNCTKVNCNPGSNHGCLLLRLRLGDLRTDRVVQPLPPPEPALRAQLGDGFAALTRWPPRGGCLDAL